jgi:hypothetical protein
MSLLSGQGTGFIRDKDGEEGEAVTLFMSKEYYLITQLINIRKRSKLQSQKKKTSIVRGGKLDNSKGARWRQKKGIECQTRKRKERGSETEKNS